MIASPPSELFVGGFFNIFSDVPGGVDVKQLEHAAAFVQAIEEINADESILPGFILRYAIRGGHGFHGAAAAASELLSLPLLAGAVNALPNYETDVITKSFSERKTLVVNSKADGAEFGDSRTYPYKAQTNPPRSFVGMVLQDYMCHNNHKRVVTFLSDDFLGTKIAMELLDGSYCPIDELGRFVLSAYDSDFPEQIDAAVRTGATVYVIALSSPQQAALLMHEAFDAGLFREGSQIYLTDASVVHHFPPGVDVGSVMHGAMLLSYYPDYSVHLSSTGAKFMQTWRNRMPWVGVCGSKADDTSVKFLRSATAQCAELDFTAYRPGGRNVSAMVALTYDATIALAYSLHHAILSGSSSLTGDDVRRALLQNVSFTGASGKVDFLEGSSSRNGYGQGNREVGHHYMIENFHKDNYAENPDTGFAVVGLWDIDSSVLTTPAELGLRYEPADFNTADNQPVSAYPPYTFESAPEVLKIAGVFSTIRSDGTVDDSQVEHLEAFLMAVEEINNKSDGIADDLLPASKLVFALSNYASDKLLAVQAVDYFLTAFFGRGVSGVVNALPSSTALATEMVASVEGMFQVLSNAGDVDLGNGKYHPFKAQTNALDTFSGMVLQQLMCYYYDVSRVVKIASATEYGAKASLEFSDGSSCSIEVLAALTFPAGTRDFTPVIDEAFDTGGLVFVLIMDASDAAQLLAQGYRRGLFTTDTQVFATNITSIARLVPSGANVPSVLKGLLSVHFDPEYSTATSSAGQGFVNRWLAREDLSARLECPSALDDYGKRNLYHNDLYPGVCAVPNMTAYRKGVKHLSPEAALTYDAVYVLAHGFHRLLADGLNVTGALMRQAVFDHVSFVGASGPIDIFEGMAELGGYAQGCRESGFHFRVLNFNAELYSSDMTSGGFGVVGVWDVDSMEMQPCLPGTTCYSPVYRSSSGAFPADMHPTIVLEMDSGVRSVLQALSALIFLLGGGVLAVVVSHRSHAEVRRAQEVLLYFIIVGILLAGGRVLVASFPLSTETCITGLWLGHLSFVFTFGALFLKAWRVNMLLNTKTIKRVAITNTNVVVKMLLIALGVVGYMLVLTFVGEPHVTSNTSESKNQITEDSFCTFEIPLLHTVLFITEGVVLGYGLALCWAIRNVPDKFNESVHNAAGISASTTTNCCICVFSLTSVFDISQLYLSSSR
jgi:ABC-type branched-subunit amino acid transport system substrate-binding protein